MQPTERGDLGRRLCCNPHLLNTDPSDLLLLELPPTIVFSDCVDLLGFTCSVSTLLGLSIPSSVVGVVTTPLSSDRLWVSSQLTLTVGGNRERSS